MSFVTAPTAVCRVRLLALLSPARIFIVGGVGELSTVPFVLFSKTVKSLECLRLRFDAMPAGVAVFGTKACGRLAVKKAIW